MEYFKELLNPVVTPSTREVGAWDSEKDSAITQVEVIEIVTKILGGRATGVDEFRLSTSSLWIL